MKYFILFLSLIFIFAASAPHENHTEHAQAITKSYGSEKKESAVKKEKPSVLKKKSSAKGEDEGVSWWIIIGGGFVALLGIGIATGKRSKKLSSTEVERVFAQRDQWIKEAEERRAQDEKAASETRRRRLLTKKHMSSIRLTLPKLEEALKAKRRADADELWNSLQEEIKLLNSASSGLTITLNQSEHFLEPSYFSYSEIQDFYKDPTGFFNKHLSSLKERINTLRKQDDAWSKIKAEYDRNATPEIIQEYAGLLLQAIDHRVGSYEFKHEYECEYNPDTRILILDHKLPSLSDVFPFLESRAAERGYKKVEKEAREGYDQAIYFYFLLALQQIFTHDTQNAIDAIVFNGWVTNLNKATGHDETHCVMTVQVRKEDFLKIDSSRVDAKAFFKSMKGSAHKNLGEFIPVAPIVRANTEDRRFVESYNVIEYIDEGENLASMDWEDFEHLVREVFEKEFSANGSEVKVTQASRDGGVDAVIFDPDPIRGGKMVIQAKRYTNTVGVSAVRELYGTLQDEGAMKGILITTSSYGPDAHEFAKGKPISLMNGGDLLQMLARHGKKARINLAEAKKDKGS